MPKLCYTYEYDGTLEGFQLLVNRLGYGCMWPFKIAFLTDDHQQTSVFTGIIQLEGGLILKAGDWYKVTVEE